MKGLIIEEEHLWRGSAKQQSPQHEKVGALAKTLSRAGTAKTETLACIGQLWDSRPSDTILYDVQETSAQLYGSHFSCDP